MKSEIKNLPLDPNVEIFRWGPVPGRYFYNSDFVDSIFPHLPPPWEEVAWPRALFLFREGRMLWLNELVELQTWGTEVFKKYILPRKVRQSIKEGWQTVVEELLSYERKLDQTDFKNLRDAELLKRWQDFYDLLQRFWVPTILQEGGNYGSAHYLESELGSFVEPSQMTEVMETLTAPEELSFYQEEEIYLAETSDIEAHQRKFFWLKNSYAGVSVLPVEFFAERKKEIPKDIRSRFDRKIRNLRERKAAIQKKFSLPESVVNIAEALCDGIVWQDERKKYIWMYLHYKELFLSEIAKRKAIPAEDLRNLGCHEIASLLGGTSFDKELEKRKIAFGFDLSSQGLKLLGEKDAVYYWDLYTEEKVEQDLKEFEGILASKGLGGKVRGRVRIMLDPHKLEFLEEGDILVTAMTSPEYVFAMKKAAAIVTDAGGLTSHAAVTSRELSKPCIVGTKIATKVLKDGDLVEVDAERGIVRRL